MMIYVTWIAGDCMSHSADFDALDGAKAFVYDYLLSEPVAIDSVIITRGTKKHYPYVTASKNRLVDSVVTWIDWNGVSDKETLKNPRDALRFVKEYLLSQPVIFNSIKIGEQGLKLTI